MEMSLGTGRGPRAEINMTPMIDVLLVLIIIFMMIAPTRSVGLPSFDPAATAAGLDRYSSAERYRNLDPGRWRYSLEPRIRTA
jgi:biopolymer transport protein ExbD